MVEGSGAPAGRSRRQGSGAVPGGGAPADRFQQELPHAEYDVPVQLVLTDG